MMAPAPRTRLACLGLVAAVLCAVPAQAQIAQTQISGLSGARVYRSNVAYDSVNQVYLVISARPPVSGRFLTSNGIQIGPDFQIAFEEGYTGWASVAFGGPANDPVFVVTYVLADQVNNPKFARLVRYVPGSAPNIGPGIFVTDVNNEWLFSEKAQNVWNGSQFVIGTRVLPPGTSMPTPIVNLLSVNGAISAPVILGDGTDYQGSPAIACAMGGICLAIGFQAGRPTGYTGGTWGRLFDGQSLTPQGGLLHLNVFSPNEDQGVVFMAHTGFFLAEWFRGGGPGYIDTRLVSPDGAMSALDTNRGIGPGAGCNYIVYNSGTQTALLVTKGPTAEFLALELGDDGYPKDPNNVLTLTTWDGSVLDYLPSVAANPTGAQWLVTAEITAGALGWLIQGTAVAPSTLPPNILTSANLPAATESTPYTSFMLASGSSLPYTWTLVSGSLPPGINLLGSSLNGTPTTPGTYNFRLRVTGADSQFSEKNFTLVVLPIIFVPPGPQGAQISAATGAIGLFPGNAYRNNVAYDSVNQVYLVIVSRPPVVGRFYNKNGVQVGTDFVIADEGGFTAWASVAFGGPANDPAFIVTYVIAQDPNPKYARLVRYVPGVNPAVSAPAFITHVGSEWLFSEKAQNVWNGQRFVVGTRVRMPGMSLPTFQVNHLDMNGAVSAPQDLGNGLDYYGSPALACAANGTCLAIGFMAGIPSGFTGGTYARLFNGATLAPQGSLFHLAAGRPNEDQGVVYQAHTGNFLTQWFRGTNGGFIDTRLVGTNGTMSILDLSRGIAGPGAGCNAFAYNPLTRTTLLITKGQVAELLAIELGDDGYPLNPNNWLLLTPWDGLVLDYLPSVAANPVDGHWMVTWELNGGGFYQVIQGTPQSGGSGGGAVQNGDFANGMSGWTVFNPSSDIVTNVNGGVLEFYRLPAAPGSQNPSVLQPLGLAVGANVSISAQFSLGNSSAARKRMTVILHDSNFNDLQFCTFWLDAGAPLRTYVMRTFTTQAWANATLSFYPASEGSDGGAYRLDNVSASLNAGFPTDRSDCVDPTAPVAPGGNDGPEMVANGDFGSAMSSWLLFGQINAQVNGGVFQFVRPNGAPAGSVLQFTGQGVAHNTPVTATFELGNNSSTRKRVTVIVHDLDFDDLQACSFWLSPGQALTTYTLRTFTGRAWANAAVSFYLGSVDTDQWARIDNVSVKRTPGSAVIGTQCLRGGAGSNSQNSTASVDAAADAGVKTAPASSRSGSSSVSARTAQPRTPITLDPTMSGADTGEWLPSGRFAQLPASASGTPVWASSLSGVSGEIDRLTWNKPIDLRNAGSAGLQFMSRRTGDAELAEVQVSLDGISWTKLGDVSADESWTQMHVDLSDYLGQVVFIRFVHAPGASGSSAEWFLSRVGVVLNSPPPRYPQL